MTLKERLLTHVRGKLLLTGGLNLYFCVFYFGLQQWCSTEGRSIDLSTVVDGWINCDEDFCEEVNFCLDLTNKSIVKELQEIRDIFSNLKRRID